MKKMFKILKETSRAVVTLLLLPVPIITLSHGVGIDKLTEPQNKDLQKSCPAPINPIVIKTLEMPQALIKIASKGRVGKIDTFALSNGSAATYVVALAKLEIQSPDS